jgi:hypothetical protein
MDFLLPIWHKEIFVPVRLLENYSNDEISNTHQEQEEQFDHLGSENEYDYGHIMNPT